MELRMRKHAPIWRSHLPCSVVYTRVLLRLPSSVEHAVLHLQKYLPDFVKRLCCAEVELMPLGLVCHPVDEREAGDAQRPDMLAPLCWPIPILGGRHSRRLHNVLESQEP
jgi:hypothetical protein